MRSIILVLDHGGDMVMRVLLKFRRLKRKTVDVSCVRLIFSVFICMSYKLQTVECMLVTCAVKFPLGVKLLGLEFDHLL